MNKEDVIASARFKVEHGPNRGRRPHFMIWNYGTNQLDTMQTVNDGEEFEIILAPKRKKVVYSHAEVSAKFVALRRISDGQVYESFYVNVRYDTISL